MIYIRANNKKGYYEMVDGGCLIAPIYRPKNAEEGYKRTEMYALQYVAQGRCYTGLNAYLTESMTRYVLGNEKSTFNSSNAVVNPRIAKTIGVKSTGGGAKSTMGKLCCQWTTREHKQ